MATASSAPVSIEDFQSQFQVLTGNAPYPWQEKLFREFLSGSHPPDISLPTGSGKTSIMAVWLVALAQQALEGPRQISIPRRLVWIVDRRVVVDQATDEAEHLRKRLEDDSILAAKSLRAALGALSGDAGNVLAISTLRGEREDNREWSRNPSCPAVIVGTVDMIGSRLLFSGYGDGRYWAPQHAGLLGHDALIVNDEAHLTPALAELLRKIENVQQGTLKPFRTMRLSATHGAPRCWPESLEEDSQDSRFHNVFHASKGLHVHPATPKLETKLLEIATRSDLARTLIFVCEPEKARKVADSIAKKTGREDRILTLTGTMRGYERDRLVESEVFKAFAKPERPTESCWLVATSAGEVGINISADVLITELDTLDHLLQRFGRLNRFGESDGVAHLLVTEAEEKLDDKDERKKRYRAALEFLRALPKREDGSRDISPAALFGLELPEDAISPRPLEAPLHAWHIDVWSQTSLRAHPSRPEVAPWLHGKVENAPETYVAWREDVNDLVADGIDDSDREEVLEKYRLFAHEQLREPTFKLIDKFAELFSKEDRDIRVLRRKPDGSVDGPFLNRLVRRLEAPANRRNAIRQLSYCQLILPPGLGRPRNGMFSPEFGASHFAESHEGRGNGQPESIAYDVSGSGIAAQSRASFRAIQASAGKWSLVRMDSAPDEYPIDDLERSTLVRFGADHRWRFLLKVQAEQTEDASGPQANTALLYFGPSIQSNRPIAETLFVDQHNSDVANEAAELGKRLGLDDDLIRALRTAGSLHDLGKAEQVWQRAAGNIKDGALVRGVPVAKPIKLMQGRQLGGFRHELASLLQARPRLKAMAVAHSTEDLVFHLVAAHHGHARPCFEAKAYDRGHLRDSANEALESVLRFARLQERYGAWGLAYLEAILKAADALASQRAQEQPTNA